MRRTIFSLASMTVLLSGCMVGPKYVKSTVPMAPGFKEDSAWQTAKPADNALRGDWWTIFGDEQLNTLEPLIAQENQSAKAAEARFREARSLIQFNKANLAPTIGTTPSAGGLRESSNRPYFSSTVTNSNGIGDLQLPLDLSYEVDLWGRIRRGISAAREEATASAGDYQSALLSLQAELAVDYFEARAADAEEKLLNDTVKYYEEAYKITNNRFEGGVSPKSDVDQAATQLQAAKVQESDVEVTRAQFEHAIAVLIGKPPSDRKSTRLNSSHQHRSRMPSSA